MRTATNVSKSAPKSRAALSAKAKRPVKAATLASDAPARSIGTTEAPKGTLPLKKLCAEIGINPKVARRELRKHRREAIEAKEKSGLTSHGLHTRWFLSGAQLTEARKILTDYVERNGESEAPAPKAETKPAKKAAKKK
jgi:hypothetical protein